jgi:alkanesulfonate monooxygenase SsuD/methylene tetrahydromethanopterin reductase-like flavin-dependent oxidoreductase (luciferase family)
MRIGMTLPTMMPGLDGDTLLAWARRIDDGPFTTLAMGERIAFPNPDLMVTMGAAAAVTTRVELMPTVVVLPLHAAAMVAKQMATLDVLSNGRVTVGVGVGGREEDFRVLGAPFARRLGRMEMQVRAMRAVWRGEPVEADTTPVGPRPLHEPPLLIGALNHDSIRRAAHWADGLCGFSFGPDGAEIGAAFEAARTAWAERDRPAPRLVVTAWYALGTDGRERMDAYAARYLDVFGARAARSLAKLCTTTSAAELTAAIRRMADAGADDFVLVPTTTDPDDVARVADIVGGIRAAAERRRGLKHFPPVSAVYVFSARSHGARRLRRVHGHCPPKRNAA